MSFCQNMRYLPVLADQRLGAAADLEVTQAVGTQQEVAEDGGASVLHVGIGNLISSFSSPIVVVIIRGEVKFSRHHRGREPYSPVDVQVGHGLAFGHRSILNSFAVALSRSQFSISLCQITFAFPFQPNSEIPNPKSQYFFNNVLH